MTINRLHEILTILLKYKKPDDTDYCYVCAEHDEIFLYGPEPAELSKEDAARLDDLGCTWHENEGWHVWT